MKYDAAKAISAPLVLIRASILAMIRVTIGVSDTAVKWRLINGMVNYFFDVDWLDNFRFQLVDKEVATDVPVLRIYHFHRME